MLGCCLDDAALRAAGGRARKRIKAEDGGDADRASADGEEDEEEDEGEGEVEDDGSGADDAEVR